ncbi:hypothetical protein I5E97_05590 [Proteus hauseri]|nr:hypothetical protein [Proteus hauseri]MBG6030522.1 hypothetical protein [Proteus hauseri]
MFSCIFVAIFDFSGKVRGEPLASAPARLLPDNAVKALIANEDKLNSVHR